MHKIFNTQALLFLLFNTVHIIESSGLLLEGWSSTVLLALALILTAAVVLFGCTWCYRHKDCKVRINFKYNIKAIWGRKIVKGTSVS